MLPQLFVFGVMVAACWFTSKWVRQEVDRVDGEMRRAQRVLQRVRKSPQLRFNPVTGHFHPAE